MIALFADLRIKMEPVTQQDESPSSTAGNNLLNVTTSANGTIHLQSNYHQDSGGPTGREKEILQASLWNSVTGKLAKSGAVNTPDGEFKSIQFLLCTPTYFYVNLWYFT